MSERADLRAAVLAQSSVAALIGARLYPQTLPQGATLPAMTMTLISRVGEQGHSNGGLALRRWQFDCWGESQADADAVADALVAAMDATADVAAGPSFVENDIDQYEPETQRWRRIVDVMVLST